MRRLGAIARQEWRLQIRSGRFRVAVLGYLVLSAVPPAVLYFLIRRYSLVTFGPSSYLAQALVLQPCLVILLAILLVGARSGTESLREQWSPLASAPLGGLGFLGRRWLTLLALLLPLTLVPLLVAAGIAYASGAPVVAWEVWLQAWLMTVLPRALLASAVWLALVTIAGSELLALVFGVLGMAMLQALLNQILLRFQWTLMGAGEWLGIGTAYSWARWTRVYLSESRYRRYHPGFIGTEAPYDLAAAWDWLLPRTLLVASCALGLLVIAGLFLGRTRRDLRPLRVGPNHPLRTYMKMWNDWRTQHAPDAAPSRGERLTMAMGLFGALALLGLLLLRVQGFEHLAKERFVAATEHAGTPLSTAVRPAQWRLSGTLHPAGDVVLEGEGRLANSGQEPAEELAFTLNSGLEVQEMFAEGYRLEVARHWDRLRLRLEPPLAPGEEIHLRWRIVGKPARPQFGLRKERGAVSFVQGYGVHATSRFSRYLTDLSRGNMGYAVGPRRVDLQPGDLGPVPRYAPWTLTPPKTAPNEFGQLVPPETIHLETEVELDLVGPQEWLLADSCAHRSVRDGGRSRLSGRCRVALSQWVIRGGSLELLEDTASGVALGMLPAHRDRGSALLRSLTAAAPLSERAWPGSAGLKDLVVLEWPPPFDIHLTEGMREASEELDGQLLSLPEGMVISSSPIEGERLVASALVREQMGRRKLHVDQTHHFRELFRGLMIRRMGLDKDGATFTGGPWMETMMRTPILDADFYYRDVLQIRLPSVMVEVESRVGSRRLYEGIERFLDRKEAPPGTMNELFDDLEAVSGVSLERMLEDYFYGNALPLLRLEAVEATRVEGGRWRVVGKVRNTGSGEVMCPVVVKTEVGEAKEVVVVDTKSATAFELSMGSRPLTVLLDPQKTCFRFVHRNAEALERVYLQGGGP